MRYFLVTLILAALTGCSTPTSTAPAATDLTATNTAIDNATTAVNGLGAKSDANTAAVVTAINGLGGKLDALAPAGTAPVAKVDPDTCTLPTGMTATAFDKKTRHITGTQDAVITGKMLVIGCDVESVQGWQAWNVSGLKLGTADNGQDGLIVDGNGNAFNIENVRGHYSTKATTVKGRKLTVACIPGISPDACKAKPVEKSATTITLTLPPGTRIVKP